MHPTIPARAGSRPPLNLIGAVCLALLVLSGPGRAASLNLPSSSSGESFTVAYSGNSHYFVFLLEYTSSNSTVIHSASGSPASDSFTIQKPNGTYGYRLRLCDRMTGFLPTNCTNSPVKQITVNRSSGGGAVTLDYTYDALGRLELAKENGSTKAGYCYDKAGNRLALTGSDDPCATSGGSGGGSGSEPEVPPAPTGLNYHTHTGGGYTINWNAVSGVSHYRLRLVNNAPDPGPYTVSPDQTTYYTNTSEEIPKWIQACNNNGCSTRAFF